MSMLIGMADSVYLTVHMLCEKKIQFSLLMQDLTDEASHSDYIIALC